MWNCGAVDPRCFQALVCMPLRQRQACRDASGGETDWWGEGLEVFLQRFFEGALWIEKQVSNLSGKYCGEDDAWIWYCERSPWFWLMFECLFHPRFHRFKFHDVILISVQKGCSAAITACLSSLRGKVKVFSNMTLLDCQVTWSILTLTGSWW